MNTLPTSTSQAVIASGDTHFIFSDDVLVPDANNPDIIATHTPDGLEIKPGGQNTNITLTPEQIDELRKTGKIQGIIESPEAGKITIQLAEATDAILSGREFIQKSRYAHRPSDPHDSTKVIANTIIYLQKSILDGVDTDHQYKGRHGNTRVQIREIYEEK